jgi:anti-anti-sigma regulatory factor
MQEIAPPEITKIDEVTVVTFGADYVFIYEHTVDQVQFLLDLMGETEPPLVVINLGHTKHCGSAFLGFLLRLSSRVSGRDGGRFAVSNLLPFCKTVVETTKMNLVWELFETQEEAITAFSKSVS